MAYGNEFINAGTAGSTWGLLNSTFGPDDHSGHSINASNLEAMCLSIIRAVSNLMGNGYIYIPAGRYIIGRLPATGGVPLTTRNSAEQLSDLIIPPGVTLIFATGAVLVAAGYDDLVNRTPSLRSMLIRNPGGGLPPSEQFKVRIEVQGDIQAPIHQIFDAFMEDRNISSAVPTMEAGRILFQSDAIRAVYPEWWGAVPLKDEATGADADVRRTTAALQAALDAAFNHRISPASGVMRPSIAVVLANDYAIDRPLRVGLSVSQAHFETVAELPGYKYGGFILRGECGPATRQLGAALIKAAPNFAVPPSLGTVPEVDSMFVARTGAGITVENVVFDANEFARRCVTLSLPGDKSHHNGFTGCEFRNARRELVWIGGEAKVSVPSMVAGVPPRIEFSTFGDVYFSASMDYSGFRFTRCRFDTGATTPLRVQNTLGQLMTTGISKFAKEVDLPEIWRIGVVFRANESLGTEFHACIFVGPASPMILALGGRLSLQGCAFRTDMVKPPGTNPDNVTLPTMRTTPEVDDTRPRWWNGTDIYVAAGFNERFSNGSVEPTPPSGLTARDVTSRSRQFLTTYPAIRELTLLSNQSVANVLLIRLRHENSFHDDEQRPAIYWGGPRNGNNVLTLMDCLFGLGLDWRGGVYIELQRGAPVVDLGSRRIGGGELLHSLDDLLFPLHDFMRFDGRM